MQTARVKQHATPHGPFLHSLVPTNLQIIGSLHHLSLSLSLSYLYPSLAITCSCRALSTKSEDPIRRHAASTLIGLPARISGGKHRPVRPFSKASQVGRHRSFPRSWDHRISSSPQRCRAIDRHCRYNSACPAIAVHGLASSALVKLLLGISSSVAALDNSAHSSLPVRLPHR